MLRFTLGLLCCPGDLCKGWPTCRGADMRMFHALRTTHMHRWAQFVRNAGWQLAIEVMRIMTREKPDIAVRDATTLGQQSSCCIAGMLLSWRY
eukprot:1343253-Amphidinium_carterae.1